MFFALAGRRSRWDVNFRTKYRRFYAENYHFFVDFFPQNDFFLLKYTQKLIFFEKLTKICVPYPVRDSVRDAGRDCGIGICFGTRKRDLRCGIPGTGRDATLVLSMQFFIFRLSNERNWNGLHCIYGSNNWVLVQWRG